jgi:hypothetical protein
MGSKASSLDVGSVAFVIHNTDDPDCVPFEVTMGFPAPKGKARPEGNWELAFSDDATCWKYTAPEALTSRCRTTIVLPLLPENDDAPAVGK